jgi:dTDP-4-dehydrorhamnose reductase
MRILVTGVSGQIGGALLRQVRGHDVIAADRAKLDLTQPQQIEQALDGLAPELIINPAAYTAVDKAEDERDLAYLVNAMAPAEMARWAASRDVPLLHFSTDYVFEGGGERPWREDDPTLPLSAYGASKLAGENAVRAAGGVFLIVRTSWVYAAQGKNFLRTIADLARERKSLRIVSDQVGAPTSAVLIAEIVANMAQDGLDTLRRSCTKSNGLVHLCARGETTWYGFAGAIVDGLRARGVTLAVEQIHPISSEEYPTRAKRPGNSRLDLSRLWDVFDVTPRPWRDALDSELDSLANSLR